jgi:hypothetical protein
MLLHLYSHAAGSTGNNALGSFDVFNIQVFGLNLSELTQLLPRKRAGFIVTGLAASFFQFKGFFK